MYRTHNCGELRIENVGQEVTLAGWVQKVRNLGAMAFIDLRDRFGITQITVEDGTTILEAAAQNDIYIPTLCFLKDINEIGSHRKVTADDLL